MTINLLSIKFLWGLERPKKASQVSPTWATHHSFINTKCRFQLTKEELHHRIVHPNVMPFLGCTLIITITAKARKDFPPSILVDQNCTYIAGFLKNILMFKCTEKADQDPRRCQVAPFVVSCSHELTEDLNPEKACYLAVLNARLGLVSWAGAAEEI
jgi:hypothetical protein